MTKLKRIKQLREKYNNTPITFPLFEELLDILEQDYSEAYERDNPPISCCEKYETCTNACVGRAEYYKNNARVELNKLALSILKESLKDEGYRQSWVANISMSLYDVVFRYKKSHTESRNLIDACGKESAELFLERLFGVVK